MPETNTHRPPILQLNLKNKAQLYAAYMPFILNGGLFLKTSRPVRLGDEVKDVQATDRLTKSPMSLITGAGQMTLNMERLMRAHGQQTAYASVCPVGRKFLAPAGQNFMSVCLMSNIPN